MFQHKGVHERHVGWEALLLRSARRDVGICSTTLHVPTCGTREGLRPCPPMCPMRGPPGLRVGWLLATGHSITIFLDSESGSLAESQTHSHQGCILSPGGRLPWPQWSVAAREELVLGWFGAEWKVAGMKISRWPWSSAASS